MMRRLPRLEEIRLGDLKLDPGLPPDDDFVRLYMAYETGQLTAIRTRVQLDRIVAGTPIRDGGTVARFWRHEIDPEVLASFIFEIRTGQRPTLVLYDGSLAERPGALVCSDDEYAFEAYRACSIGIVPALILSSEPRDLTEAYFLVRAPDRYKTMSWGRPEVHAFQSIVRNKTGRFRYSPSAAIGRLIQFGEKVLGDVQAFHLPASSDPVHYHHTLYSVGSRLVDGLRAIRILFETENHQQALPIVRSLYELSLVFYVDWLAPEAMGPLLQLVGRLSKETEEDRKLHKEIRVQFGRAFHLCQSVVERARISPLSLRFYNEVYSYLSRAAHQDFSITERQSSFLEEGATSRLQQRELRTVVTWLDFIAAMVFSRIRSDVGKDRT